MDASRLAKVAAAILAVNLLLFGVVPWAAEQVLESRLEVELATQFGADVEVDAEVTGLPAILRGELRRLVVEVPAHARVVEGVEVELRDARLVLDAVAFDLGEVFAGGVTTVEAGASSSFTANVRVAAVVQLVRDRLEEARPDLGPIDVEAAGANLLVTANAAGTPTTVEVRPAVVAGAVVLIPVDGASDGPSEALADAIAGEAVALPSLPLGLRFADLVLDGDVAVLTADVPGTLDLSRT